MGSRSGLWEFFWGRSEVFNMPAVTMARATSTSATRQCAMNRMSMTARTASAWSPSRGTSVGRVSGGVSRDRSCDFEPSDLGPHVLRICRRHVPDRRDCARGDHGGRVGRPASDEAGQAGSTPSGRSGSARREPLSPPPRSGTILGPAGVGPPLRPPSCSGATARGTHCRPDPENAGRPAIPQADRGVGRGCAPSTVRLSCRFRR